MRGACSQAKNTIPRSLLPTKRCRVALALFFTKTACRWLSLIVGISWLFHFPLKLIER